MSTFVIGRQVCIPRFVALHESFCALKASLPLLSANHCVINDSVTAPFREAPRFRCHPPTPLAASLRRTSTS
eukprot:11308463-Prorocentrum_lima.AAC.1